jgi:hypothetical protein
MGRIGVAEELGLVANACEQSCSDLTKAGNCLTNWAAVSFEGNTVDSEVGEWVGLWDCRVHWPFKGIYELSKLSPPPNRTLLQTTGILNHIFWFEWFCRPQLSLYCVEKWNRTGSPTCRICFKRHLFKTSSGIPDIFWFCWIFIASVGVRITYSR